MAGVRKGKITALTVSSLFLITIVFTTAQPPAGVSQKEQTAALLHLRSSLGLRHKEWPTNSDPCTNWVGINCTAGQVTGINISGFHRTPAGMQNPQFAVDALQNLTQLKSFIATNFSLPGPIPDWFGINLTSLQFLDLRSCSIYGTIPITLNRLTHLVQLHLSNNRLTGELPDNLFPPLIQLQFLDLHNNNFSGEFPYTIWSLPALEFLDTSTNFFTGMLPSFNISGTGNRTSFANISNNLFYGEITLVVVKKFNSIDMSHNFLEGRVPAYKNETMHYDLNCLVDAKNQRAISECRAFYNKRDLHFQRTTETGESKKEKKHIAWWPFLLLGVVLLGIFIVIVWSVCKAAHARTIGLRRQGEVELQNSRNNNDVE